MAPKDQKYAAPTEKMDSLTVTKVTRISSATRSCTFALQRDFQPIDVGALPRIKFIPLKGSLSVEDQTGPMESVTMSHYHYQAHPPVVTRRQYGELVPNVYVPNMSKFEGSTTTGDAFQGRAGLLSSEERKRLGIVRSRQTRPSDHPRSQNDQYERQDGSQHELSHGLSLAWSEPVRSEGVQHCAETRGASNSDIHSIGNRTAHELSAIFLHPDRMRHFHSYCRIHFSSSVPKIRRCCALHPQERDTCWAQTCFYSRLRKERQILNIKNLNRRL